MLNFYKLHSDPNELFGYKDAHLKIPEIAWEVANTNEKKRKIEYLWVSNPEHAYVYARDVIKKPWSPGEKVIASITAYAFLYARDVIKHPWEPGEKAISSDPYLKQQYEQYFKVKL
jgi:hypothetical protein